MAELTKQKAMFTKMGVRYRLAGTGKNRWSEGKVHLQYWSKDWREWILSCRPSPGISAYYTHEIDDIETPITCKTCIKKDPRT